MRIVRLTAENLKRLVAVEITPDPDRGLVLVTGKNGAGKTSVLDAIWFALGGGGALHATPRPIREGQEQAEVTLDLGELTVTRIWRTGKPMQLKVLAADGAKYNSPQKVLDGLVGQMSFDPLAFTLLDSRTQTQMLEDLVELPFVPAELERLRRAAYDERTLTGREVTRLRGVAESMPVPPVVPAGGVDLAALLEEQSAAVDALAERRAQHGKITAAGDLLQRHKERLEVHLTQAQLAREDARRAEADLQILRDRLETMANPDLPAITERIRHADGVNRAWRAEQEREAVQRNLDAAVTTYQRLTDEIAELDEERRLGLEAAIFPVEGLSFDAEGITYHGVPFRQCSSAERLRISIGMAMALNPEIRVIRITDGSLLDSSNLALIGEMAADRDFQIWVEVVDESGEIGVVIEDGLVRDA